MRRRRRPEDEDVAAVHVEVIEPRSTHRRFVPRVAAYEVVQGGDGQFHVLERPHSAVTKRPKERKEAPIPSRAVRAVHKQRASRVKHPSLDAIASTKATRPAAWENPPTNESDPNDEDKVAALEAAIVDKVKWREAAVQEMVATCKLTSRQTTARVLKLMQCAAVVRQRSVDVVNAVSAWRGHAMDDTKEFRWLGRNYLVHMANDLDVLASETMLAHALGIPSCTHNPLLCAITFTDPQWQRYRADPSPARLAQLQAALQLSNEVDGDVLLSVLAVIANEVDKQRQPLVVAIDDADTRRDVENDDQSSPTTTPLSSEGHPNEDDSSVRPLVVSCFYKWLQCHDFHQRHQRMLQKRDSDRLRRVFAAWQRYGIQRALARRATCRRAFVTWQHQRQRWRTAKWLRRKARRRLARSAIETWQWHARQHRAVRRIEGAWRRYRCRRHHRIVLQPAATTNDARELQVMRVQLQHIQARSIQRRWRDVIAQQTLNAKMQQLKAESARVHDQLQARIVQAHWRGIRFQLHRQRNVQAATVQQWWRHAKQVQDRRREVRAAISIQVTWRWRHAQRRRMFARTIQHWWQRHNALKKSRHALLEKDQQRMQRVRATRKRIRAAGAIQRSWRLHQHTRRQVQVDAAWHVAARVVQQAWRWHQATTKRVHVKSKQRERQRATQVKKRALVSRLRGVALVVRVWQSTVLRQKKAAAAISHARTIWLAWKLHKHRRAVRLRAQQLWATRVLQRGWRHYASLKRQKLVAKHVLAAYRRYRYFAQTIQSWWRLVHKSRAVRGAWMDVYHRLLDGQKQILAKQAAAATAIQVSYRRHWHHVRLVGATKSIQAWWRRHRSGHAKALALRDARLRQIRRQWQLVGIHAARRSDILARLAVLRRSMTVVRARRLVIQAIGPDIVRQTIVCALHQIMQRAVKKAAVDWHLVATKAAHHAEIHARLVILRRSMAVVHSRRKSISAMASEVVDSVVALALRRQLQQMLDMMAQARRQHMAQVTLTCASSAAQATVAAFVSAASSRVLLQWQQSDEVRQHHHRHLVRSVADQTGLGIVQTALGSVVQRHAMAAAIQAASRAFLAKCRRIAAIHRIVSSWLRHRHHSQQRRRRASAHACACNIVPQYFSHVILRHVAVRAHAKAVADTALEHVIATRVTIRQEACIVARSAILTELKRRQDVRDFASTSVYALVTTAVHHRTVVRHVAIAAVRHACLGTFARRVAASAIQTEWRNSVRRWRFRYVFRPVATSWLVRGTSLAIQQLRRWRVQACRRLQRCWGAYRFRKRSRAQTVLSKSWRRVLWRRRRLQAALSIQKAYRAYLAYWWWLWQCRMATRIQRLVRAFLRRRKATKALVKAARNLLSKKVWSTALALGTTSVDEPYYALWLSRGAACVSCIQHRKRGFLKLDKATSRVLNTLHGFRTSKSRTKDWEIAALEVLGQVEVTETDTALDLTMPPEYALGKVLHRSESLAQVNKTKTTKRTLTALEAAAALSIPDLLDSLHDGRDVNERDAAGQTPLHVAITATCENERKVHDMVGVLLEHGADVNAKDYDGVTALMATAGNGHVDRLQQLLMAEPTTVRLDAVDNKGYTALHHACAKNQIRACEVLLAEAQERHMSLNTSSYDGMYPLHVLAILGHVECACGLQQGDGAWDVNVRDAEGRSPLHLAIAYNHSTFVTYLLEMGASPDARDNLSRTPLHYAMECKSGLEMVSSLRKFKVDLNAADERGDTALHWAAHSGHQKLVNHLVNLGADTMLQNTDWETPAQLAAANGHEGCVAIFARGSKKKRHQTSPAPEEAAAPSVTSYISMGDFGSGAADASIDVSTHDEPAASDEAPPPDASQWVYDEYGGCYDTTTGTYWSPDGYGGYYDATNQVANAEHSSDAWGGEGDSDPIEYGDASMGVAGVGEHDADHAKAWADYYASFDPAVPSDAASGLLLEANNAVEWAAADHGIAPMETQSFGGMNGDNQHLSDTWIEPVSPDDDYLIEGVPPLSDRVASITSHGNSSPPELVPNEPMTNPTSAAMIQAEAPPSTDAVGIAISIAVVPAHSQGIDGREENLNIAPQPPSSLESATATNSDMGREETINDRYSPPLVEATEAPTHSTRQDDYSTDAAFDSANGSTTATMDRSPRLASAHVAKSDGNDAANAFDTPALLLGPSFPSNAPHDQGTAGNTAIQPNMDVGCERDLTDESDSDLGTAEDKSPGSTQWHGLGPQCGGGEANSIRLPLQDFDEPSTRAEPFQSLEEISVTSSAAFNSGRKTTSPADFPSESEAVTSIGIRAGSINKLDSETGLQDKGDDAATDAPFTSSVPAQEQSEGELATQYDATADPEPVAGNDSSEGWSDEWTQYYASQAAGDTNARSAASADFSGYDDVDETCVYGPESSAYTAELDAGGALDQAGAIPESSAYTAELDAGGALDQAGAIPDGADASHTTSQLQDDEGDGNDAAWAAYYASLAARDGNFLSLDPYYQQGAEGAAPDAPLPAIDMADYGGHDIQPDDYSLDLPQLDSHRSSTTTTSHHSHTPDQPKTVQFLDDDDGDSSTTDVA